MWSATAQVLAETVRSSVLQVKQVSCSKCPRTCGAKSATRPKFDQLLMLSPTTSSTTRSKTCGDIDLAKCHKALRLAPSPSILTQRVVVTKLSRTGCCHKVGGSPRLATESPLLRKRVRATGVRKNADAGPEPVAGTSGHSAAASSQHTCARARQRSAYDAGGQSHFGRPIGGARPTPGLVFAPTPETEHGAARPARTQRHDASSVPTRAPPTPHASRRGRAARGHTGANGPPPGR